MSLTAQQLEERTAGLGGSDALAYCGKDPRKTPLELYLEKLGETPVPSDPEHPEHPEHHQDTDRKRWGSRLEPVVRDWLAEEIGRRIHTSNRLYRSTELPFMTGHLDGITASPMEGVEIKTADKYMAQEFGEVGTDAVPVRYVLQMTHYMVVTRLRRFHLAALLGGNDARHYVIDYDPDLAAMLIDRASTFWLRHVETRTPPEPVNLADADRRWPHSQGRVVVANEVIAHAVGELKTLRATEQSVAKQADAIETSLKVFLGDAGGLIDSHHKLLATWRSQSRERFDLREFAKDHPDMADRYRTVSSFRVFRLK